jgi:Na+/melibiose symporter-like transporter
MLPSVRILALAGGTLLLFAATVAVLLRVIPAPHRDIDYLVIGGVATLVCLLALFVVLVTTVFRAPDTFFRKKPAPGAQGDGQAEDRRPEP